MSGLNIEPSDKEAWAELSIHIAEIDGIMKQCLPRPNCRSQLANWQISRLNSSVPYSGGGRLVEKADS